MPLAGAGEGCSERTHSRPYTAMGLHSAELLNGSCSPKPGPPWYTHPQHRLLGVQGLEETSPQEMHSGGLWHPVPVGLQITLLESLGELPFSPAQCQQVEHSNAAS